MADIAATMRCRLRVSRKRLVGTYGSMTHPNNPGTRRQADLSSRLTRRRHKLAPDPGIRRAILVAASMSVREHGVRGLSVATVLDRAQLSTRAFYRHFESKDQLVAAVFLEVARVEAVRLRTLMAKATNPIQGVAAWIDGRLDLAFDDAVKADLRHLSMDAQSHLLNAPELVEPAYAETLEPLIEQLRLGVAQEVFHDIDPHSEARSIQGVVWANTEQQWASGDCRRDEVRESTVRFCLRGLGVAPDTIAQITAPD
ncbi:TetR/AcrR family transcriptional regulator [Mycobacterium marinum]|uniref:TetR/AcrR family transcriptional regulator n=1 Tax=Mycobacterium marinum TaxID=1781 RepID=UPI0023408E79|nr:TetR/AcrR family transcriptional regulator [Mycobacterium marinum]MDC8981749.1 TetR/AcrR family transcriptional regulator [Mycobacterium marinum]MDC8993192.1 TetR/AcrR family transcriptional regulator [Mycobacterium marinum]MDC8998210.1 TetR/AcrR family transcriptional regulator [Mycobacterium marinum]MDC9009465.1 TetR/AcrR family transcriptional regulator [Mycobacterium marinum]WDZ15389.1 TetR/AcrR family transcriptional regulator [Mycobacterium marinum]